MSDVSVRDAARRALGGVGPGWGDTSRYIEALRSALGGLLAELDRVESGRDLSASTLDRTLRDFWSAAGVTDDIDDVDYVLELIDGNRRRLDAALSTLQKVRSVMQRELAASEALARDLAEVNDGAGLMREESVASHMRTLLRIIDGGAQQ